MQRHGGDDACARSTDGLGTVRVQTRGDDRLRRRRVP
jgi:hypothetical protein